MPLTFGTALAAMAIAATTVATAAPSRAACDDGRPAPNNAWRIAPMIKFLTPTPPSAQRRRTRMPKRR
jgi:hypothetical protein